jgi:hypothetical protein
VREILEAGLLWQPHDRLKAIRMLGRQPLDATDDQRVMAIYLCCWAMDPEDQYGFTDLYNELTAKERMTYLERLNAREPMTGMPASPEAARSDLLALIVNEEQRLEGVLEGHLEREEAELQAALAFDDSAWGERLRRCELSSDKTLLRIIETLRKRQADAGEEGPPGGARSSGGCASVRAGSGCSTGDLRSAGEQSRETCARQPADDIVVGVPTPEGPDDRIPPEGVTPAAGSGDPWSGVGARQLEISP